MKISLIILFITSILSSFAQTIETTLTPGWGFSVVQSHDGGYVICGRENNSVLLTKADSSGQPIWTKHFGDSMGTNYISGGNDLILLSDGGFLVCGNNSDSSGANDAYFIRTDPNGNLIWEKHYSGPFNNTDEYNFLEIKQNSVGEFIAAGHITYNQYHPDDIVLMKLDSGGNQIWHKEIDLGSEESFKDLEINDTAFTIIGSSYPSLDQFILRTDSSGNMNFNRFYHSLQFSQHQIFSDFLIDQNQNYIITGNHWDSLGSYIDFFVFDYAGDSIFYNSTIDPFYLAISITGFFKHTDGYVIYGFSHRGIGNSAAFIKVDSLGNKKWWKRYSDIRDETFYSGILTSNGILAFAGKSSLLSGPDSVFLVVTDSTGAIFTSSNSAIENDLPIRLQQSTSQINIVCENNLCGPFEIEIYNLLGEKFISNKGSSVMTAGLRKGIYIFSATDIKRHQRFTSKFIVIN